MRKIIVSAVLALLGAAVAPSTPAIAREMSMQARMLTPATGDVLIQREGADWSVVKVISMETWPDGSMVAHVLLYADTPERPTLEQTAALTPFVLHAPMDARAFAEGWERLGNLPVEARELEGFHEYLKQTDFPRYLEETGVSVEEIVGAANRNYQRGYALSEAGDHEGAIAAYDQAIELFPLFFEAIDNRAFSYMDMGRYDVALEGFEQSLRVNPDGVTAVFSRGECLLRLGRLDEAEAAFQDGLNRFPDQSEIFTDFLARTRAAKAGKVG